jgi:hypothetical protein
VDAVLLHELIEVVELGGAGAAERRGRKLFEHGAIIPQYP